MTEIRTTRLRGERRDRGRYKRKPGGEVERFEAGSTDSTKGEVFKIELLPDVWFTGRNIDGDHWELFSRRVNYRLLDGLNIVPAVLRDRYRKDDDQPVADVGDQAVESSGDGVVA